MEKNGAIVYSKKMAGSLMTAKVPLSDPESTITTLENYLLENVKKLDSIDYVYVVSKQGKLLGVMSIKEIFRQPKSKKVSEVMIKDLVVAHPHTDKERVAFLSLRHNIKSVPVVDPSGKFLGAVLSDMILDTLYREAQEDILHLAGVGHHKINIDDVTSMSLFLSLKHRLPWLLIGLFGGILAAKIIGFFENTLSENIILASFIPLIVYMASAVGTQIGFFVVRDLAINSKIKFFLYFFRQLLVVVTMGLVISFLVLLISWVFYNNLFIGFVLALAMLLAILSSVITGLFIPYAFSKLNSDPANASGPVATIIQDILSVTIYLLVAQWLL